METTGTELVVAKPKGRPFQKGNPGKPHGARRKTSILAERLLAENAEGIIKSVIASALEGDMAAAKICVDRLNPIRKGQLVKFHMPDMNAAGVSVAFSALVAAVSSGQITCEEAAAVSTLLDAQRKAIETESIEKRLDALEARK
jgi:hypothetical protein